MLRPTRIAHRSGTVGTTAATAATRVSSAVSYLRLLATLTTRAPNPTEAASRARVLLPALVSAIEVQASILRNGDAVSNDTAEATSSEATGTYKSGIGVQSRTAASDSAVLSMQTLRYLLRWSEPPSSSSSSDVAKRHSGKDLSTPSVGAGCVTTAGGDSGVSSASAGSGMAGNSLCRDNQTKGPRRQNGPSGASKASFARAAAERDGVRKAVERAFQEVMADIFSSVSIMPAAAALASASSPNAVSAADTSDRGHEDGGVPDMQVDEEADTACPSASEEDGGCKAVAGLGMQAVLRSLLQMALAVAGSSSQATSIDGAGSSSRHSSSGPHTCATSSKDAGAEAPAGSGGASSSSPRRRPMLLVERQLGAEDGGDDRDDEEALGNTPRGEGTAGPISRSVDSDSAAAAAVVAAVVGAGGTGASSPASVGGEKAAEVPGGSAAGLRASSPELLAALMTGLLGPGVEVDHSAGGGSGGGGPVRSRGAAKEKQAGVGRTVVSHGKNGVPSKSSRPAGGAEEKGASGKRRPRGSGGGDRSAGANRSGAATASSASAPPPSSSNGGGTSKVDGVVVGAVFSTTAEGLTRLNAALRTPALAVLASALQVATVSLVPNCGVRFDSSTAASIARRNGRVHFNREGRQLLENVAYRRVYCTCMSRPIAGSKIACFSLFVVSTLNPRVCHCFNGNPRQLSKRIPIRRSLSFPHAAQALANLSKKSQNVTTSGSSIVEAAPPLTVHQHQQRQTQQQQWLREWKALLCSLMADRELKSMRHDAKRLLRRLCGTQVK